MCLFCPHKTIMLHKCCHDNTINLFFLYSVFWYFGHCLAGRHSITNPGLWLNIHYGGYHDSIDTRCFLIRLSVENVLQSSFFVVLFLVNYTYEKGEQIVSHKEQYFSVLCTVCCVYWSKIRIFKSKNRKSCELCLGAVICAVL